MLRHRRHISTNMRPRPCTAVLPSRTIAQSGLPLRNRTTQYPLIVQNARTQLADVSVMIDRPRHLDSAPEREAEAIARASDQEVRDYVRRAAASWSAGYRAWCIA